MPEKRLWIVVTVSVLIVTGLPYLFGHFSEPTDRQFMGILLDVPDYGQYRSWFREFQSAHLIKNKLTPEPNDPIFFNLLWWVMGRVSRYTGLGFPILHELLRLFSGIAFFVALRALCVRVLPESRTRNMAFLLAVFGAGFGWILVVMKYTVTKGELLYPLDVYIAEPNTFLCVMAFPHFVMANALILIVFSLHFLAFKHRRLNYAVFAGLVALILGLQHAYDLFLIYGVLGTFTLLVSIKERRFSWFLMKSNTIVGLISCWPGAYSFWLTQSSPVWKEVLAQFSNADVYTPDPFHLVILMGVPLVLTVLTFDGLVPTKDQSDEILFIKGWFLSGFLLLYIPTDFQVHMLNSWQIPVAILAAKGLHTRIFPFIKRYFANRGLSWSIDTVVRFFAISIVLFSALTNVYLFLWRFVDLSRHDYPYYLYRSEVAALNWLEENSDSEDIVLSSLTVGQYLPALTGNTAFLAHWAQTVHFYDKRERVSRFFKSSTTEIERKQTLQSFGVSYVFHGPAEQQLGDYDPASSPWLELAFSLSDVRLYRVKLSSGNVDLVSRARVIQECRTESPVIQDCFLKISERNKPSPVSLVNFRTIDPSVST